MSLSHARSPSVYVHTWTTVVLGGRIKIRLHHDVIRVVL